MSDLLFEYKVRARHRLGWKEFSFYATTEIEEFLNRNSIEYVRNATDTVENRLFKENKRLNKIIEGLREERDYLFNKTTTESNYEIERLNNIINESAEEILKELEENHHLSYGVALAIRQKLINYKELKGSDKE